MSSIKFKKIYKLVEQLNKKYYEEDYKKLLKTDGSMKSLDYFISYVEKNNKAKNDEQKLNDSIILKDTIVKQI